MSRPDHPQKPDPEQFRREAVELPRASGRPLTQIVAGRGQTIGDDPGSSNLLLACIEGSAASTRSASTIYAPLSQRGLSRRSCRDSAGFKITFRVPPG
jgi:hypothetical protein